MHNTLLHFTSENQSHNQQSASSSNSVICNSNQKSYNYHETILSTAILYIKNNKNDWVKCRALLDSGSQSNFITQNLFNRLHLNHQQVNIPVIGINKSSTHISKCTHTIIQSIHSAFQTKLKFLVIPQITDDIPLTTFSVSNLKLPIGLNLADPEFYKSDNLDILLGIEIFSNLLLNERIALGKNLPILQNSKLGSIGSGSFRIHSNRNRIISNTCILQKQLKEFWEVEEIPFKKIFTKEESFVENHYKNTTRTDNSGRFIVSLPTRPNLNQLENNHDNAVRRFLSLEKNLSKDLNLKTKYSEFMNELIQLNHMTKIYPNQFNNTNICFYLPHHCVLRDSRTTSLRVVFDASSKDKNGLSLNDTLIPGPNIQDSLFNILLRFRKHPIVFTADITKMYRQIIIEESQQDLQRVIWRFNSKEPISHYKINRFIYGTSPASFIATRVLKDLAQQYSNVYPKATRKIIIDFYMDDLLSGAETVDEAKQIVQQISFILNKGNFPLRKWLSNNNDIFSNSSFQNANDNNFFIHDTTTKTLGIFWDSENDYLKYTITPMKESRHTKRTILLWISTIFGPLGLLTPVTILTKIMIQDLWKLQLDWDELLPTSISLRWNQTLSQLTKINEITIPRRILINNPSKISLRGFCDASEKAYGTWLYLVSENADGNQASHLICSKSRVAPLKTISLPRLELCGALLLTRLTVDILNAIDLQIGKIFLFTDSKIVLAWLAIEPADLKTFVANRVAEIQTSLNDNVRWYHVKSNENPADLISRGTTVDSLGTAKMWWQGPDLILNNNFSSTVDFDCELLPERRIKPLKNLIVVKNSLSWLDKFSSLITLKRVTAYILRFINNSKTENTRITGPLSVSEIKKATLIIIKNVQQEAFQSEITSLKKNSRLPKSNKLLSLGPFIDNNDILRVGGRLNNTTLEYQNKHPIILPKNHILTKLIVNYHHIKLFHAGPRLTLSSIRNEYWPIDGLSTTKKILKSCITCFRCNPKPQNPVMGQLPNPRVTPSRPFINCGVDLAGPYLIRAGAFIKTYIVLFICLSTKAVHIDLVVDLTKESFLNTFKRFISRRGLCHNIYSDNGTNLVGAYNELKRIYQSLHTLVKDSIFNNYLLECEITWHFIPSRSPSFGGLWESAIRSLKYHLKRALTNTKLTYETFYTVLVQVESILNYRPLCPLSDDPNDLEPLTPGHFIIGSSFKNLPQKDFRNVAENRLTNYQHMQLLVEHFWNRWKKEYLHTLQQRNKWQYQSDNVKVGSIVIVKEENVPVMFWPMGRITQLFPGQDGVVRVVEVKLRSGLVRRAVNKLCLLPMES